MCRSLSAGFRKVCSSVDVCRNQEKFLSRRSFSQHLSWNFFPCKALIRVPCVHFPIDGLLRKWAVGIFARRVMTGANTEVFGLNCTGSGNGRAEPVDSTSPTSFIEMKGIRLMGVPIYLDMQATTPMDPRVLDAILPFLTEEYGNPHSRTHMFGWESEDAVEVARKQVCLIVMSIDRAYVSPLLVLIDRLRKRKSSAFCLIAWREVLQEALWIGFVRVYSSESCQHQASVSCWALLSIVKLTRTSS